MYKNFFLKSLFFAILINSIISCDNDSNELGSDIIGGNNFETGTPETYDVSAMTQNTGPVETLDLPVNALGIYKNPVFGTLKANVAIQVLMDLSTVNPNFNSLLNPQIESVILTIPYFSTAGNTNSNGTTPYTLDSIYGPANSKIKLQVFESKYYIRDIDETQEIQKYYSNQNQEFDNVKGEQLNDSDDQSQNNQFVFSAAQLSEPGTVTAEDPNPDPVLSAPGMKLNLNKDFFASKILANPEKLINNNVLKEYFRGLYFHVENSGADEGNLAMLNFKAGKITIKYRQYATSPTTENPTPETESKSYILYLSGKSVGFFDTESTLTQNSDNLYLKGGEGSMAIIDLFGPDTDGDGVADKLKEIRENKWLVNDASLTFHIDKDAMGNTGEEPNRVYLYDLKNKRPLVDYYSDQTSSSKPKYAKSVFGGIIKKTDGRGIFYKVRLTNHIRGLINNADSTNVKLGLVVTENINNINNKKLKTPIIIGVPDYTVKEIPTSSIINPLGTILYGSGANVPLDKRIQLKIYFTKPKQN
jgi:hypothetical protein